MDVDDRLKFYLSLLHCSYPLYMWECDAGMRVISTTMPVEWNGIDILSILGFGELLRDYAAQGGHDPVVLSNSLGLLFFVALEYKEAKGPESEEVESGKAGFGKLKGKKELPSRMVVIGPALSGRNSASVLKEKLDAHDLPVSLRALVTRELSYVPVIPSAELQQYTRMLHYCVTGEYIDNLRIQYLFTKDHKGIDAGAAGNRSQYSLYEELYATGRQLDHHPSYPYGGKKEGDGNTQAQPLDKALKTKIADKSLKADSFSQKEDAGSLAGDFVTEHRGIRAAEMRLLAMIRDGNPDYRTAFTRSSMLSSGMHGDLGDSQRQAKNNVLVLLTLACRAAMEGGLSPDLAYSLNDLYAERIEKCSSYSEISSLANEILEDYVTRVRNAREEKGISRPVQDACNYIHAHVQERISITALAARAGYTEYYFSHKFHEETGVTVSEYVRKAKMEEASVLLLEAGKSIAEIAEELSISSRSAFFTDFRREYGCSPSEYRQHGANRGG